MLIEAIYTMFKVWTGNVIGHLENYSFIANAYKANVVIVYK
jgi:hypothetical protein